MSRQVSTRSEKTAEMGKEAMKVLFKEPIKEAVKETLAEEEVNSHQTETRTRDTRIVTENSGESATPKQRVDADEKSASSGPGLLGAKVVIPAAVLLGVAIAIRQLGEDPLNTEKLEGMISQEDDTAMEEDMSKSSPARSDRSEFSEHDSEEVNV